MIQKYLINNPIKWLLEKSNPSIRYLTLRDILNEIDNGEYKNLLNSKRIQKLLHTGKDKITGNKNKFDLYYKGSMWHFAEAVERGLDKRTGVIDKTANFITEISQMKSGGFTLNWKPEIEVSCRTGDMIKYLILAGYDDERIERGIMWILSKQRHDGGWLHCPLASSCDSLKLMLFNKSGKGLCRETNKNVKSCFYATIVCSMALINYKTKYPDSIKKAANFFLTKRLFRNSKNEPIVPKLNWNSDFRLLGYPVLSQYDILYCMNFISRAGFFHDERTAEAFNLIMSKQNPDGSWNMENTQTGMIHGNNRKAHLNKKNKWITLNVMRMLKNA